MIWKHNCETSEEFTDPVSQLLQPFPKYSFENQSFTILFWKKDVLGMRIKLWSKLIAECKRILIRLVVRISQPKTGH